MAIDFLGNEINVGDSVVFVQTNYRNLLIGEVIRITPKTVLIEHPKTNVCSRETRQEHSQVIVLKDGQLP